MSVAVERVSEEGWVPPWVRHQHLARYRWAGPYGKNRRVIEAACGTGYGAAILVENGAAAVDGFDASPEAIEEARRRHAHPGIHFAVAEAAHLPVADRDYDLFVSFETIEHLPDDRAFLREVVRVLAPDGILLCSTPNRALTNPGTRPSDKPFNPHHLREYTRTELDALLRECFARVEFFGQSFYRKGYQQTLTHIGRALPGFAVKMHQARKVFGLPWERFERHIPAPWQDGCEPEILVAVCSR